jgi:hypothetical protein
MKPKQAAIAALFLSASFLAGCASQPVPTQYIQACSAYQAAFGAAVQLRQAGKLTPAQVTAVSNLDQQITPICTGPLPTDAGAAAGQVTAAVTALGVITAAQALQGATK